MRIARRGANAIEFALTLPIAMALLAGVIDYGWFFHQQLVLQEAVRTGARVGSVTPQDGDLTGRATAAVEQVLSLNGQGRLEPEITVEVVVVANGDQAVRVRASSPYVGMWKLVALPLNVSASAVMRREEQPEE